MKRFHFSLRPVSVLRAHRQALAREAFAASIQAFSKAEEALELQRSRVALFESALQAGRRERFSPGREAEALAAYRQERAAETAAERELAGARTRMERRRAEYLEAHRQLDVLHRLEDKARTAHRHEVAREEQAAFDEFAGRQHHARTLHPSP